MKKTNTYIILKIINLINDITLLNNSKTSFFNNERLIFTFDVKSLYDSLNLDQCIDVLECLNQEYLNWNPWIFNFIIDIIKYFKNNTFVKYKNHIHQMIDGIGTGFAHSGSLANITLLYYEIKNKNNLYTNIKEKSAKYKDDYLQFLKPIHCNIICWKRYIDDKLMIIDIDASIINTSLKFGKFISTTKKSVKAIYPSNIKLKAIASPSANFLDIHLSLKPNDSISTKLFEKQMNKHQSLHWNSNNPIYQKKAILNTHLFRSICINDDSKNHDIFRIKVIERMIKRGYHPAVIRKFLSSKSMPKYKFRNRYLLKLKKRNLSNIYQNFIFIHNSNISGSNFLSLSEFDDMNNFILDCNKDEQDEKNKHTLYFLKEFQRLFDDDDELRKLLREFHGYCMFDEQEIEFIISNRSGTKIRKYLN